MISQLKIDKRELLLVAATKLFVERGFHATPTSAISKEAGVSAGILFHYFKTKDHLIESLYVEIKKEYTSAILTNVEQFKAGRSKLRLLWTNSWNWGLENPIKFKFLLQIDNSTYSNIVKQHPDIIEKYALFESLFKQYIDDSFVRSTDIYFLMNSMFSLITSMVNHLTLFPDHKDDVTFIETSWDMFYNYLKP